MNSEIEMLLVEDEVIIAMYTVEQLAEFGFKDVRHVISGEKALASIVKQKPDLILMDIGLSGKYDGIEAAEIISRDHNIPIVFLSSYDDQAIKDRSRHLKPLAYFSKPLDLKALSELVNETFAGQ